MQNILQGRSVSSFCRCLFAKVGAGKRPDYGYRGNRLEASIDFHFPHASPPLDPIGLAAMNVSMNQYFEGLDNLIIVIYLLY